MWDATKKGAKRVAQFRPVKSFIGIVLVCLGLVGLLIPVLPSWLLIFVGLVWLGIIEREDIARWIARLRRK